MLKSQQVSSEINQLLQQGFTIHQQGNLNEAKKKKVPTMPLIVNDNFDKVLMSTILITPSAQDEIIEFMIKEAEKQDYIGWQFDFENLNHLDRDLYTEFVKKTYKAMQENDLQFSVAVVPRSKPYDPKSTNQDWSSGYDFAEIAKNSDFVTLMSYDDPLSVGPVASIPFMKRTLDFMTTLIPEEKISLGIPFYCWRWLDVPGIEQKIGITTHYNANKEYQKAKNKKTREKDFDKDLGAMYFAFDKGQVRHKIWCEDEDSISAKIDLINDYGLRGFSAWALGQEKTTIWNLFKK
jgi:spore germination protein